VGIVFSTIGSGAGADAGASAIQPKISHIKTIRINILCLIIKLFYFKTHQFFFIILLFTYKIFASLSKKYDNIL
jgi:hypothetical protein